MSRLLSSGDVWCASLGFYCTETVRDALTQVDPGHMINSHDCWFLQTCLPEFHVKIQIFRFSWKTNMPRPKDLHSHMATIHRTGKKIFFTLARALQSPQSSSVLVMLNGWPPSFTFVIAYLNLKEERRQREEHDKRKGGMKYELLKRTYTRLWEEKDRWGLQWNSLWKLS